MHARLRESGMTEWSSLDPVEVILPFGQRYTALRLLTFQMVTQYCNVAAVWASNHAFSRIIYMIFKSQETFFLYTDCK